MPQPSLRRAAVIIWAVLAGALATFTGVAMVLPLRPPDPELATILLTVVLAHAVVSVALSFWVPGRMRPRGAVVTPEQMALSRTVVACALCEGPALFAVVGFMVTRDAGMLLPWLLSAGALFSHFPGAGRWERLVSRAASDAAGGSSPGARPPGGPAAGSGPPSRMVRE